MDLNKVYNMDCIKGLVEIPDKSVNMVLTDIPYGFVSHKIDNGLRRVNKDSADEVNFDMDTLLDELVRICYGSIYVFCGPIQFSYVAQGLIDRGMLMRTCLWEKTNPTPMNGQYTWLSSVECCVYARFPKATFNEFCKGTVWRYPCGQSNEHPTQKPVDLFRYLIRVSSNNGDTILDPFIGSGTTAIAAIQEGRKFIGFEINKDYYDLANRRLKKLTGPFHLYGNLGV